MRAKGLRQCAHFLAEIADQAAAAVVEARHADLCLLDKGCEARERRPCLIPETAIELAREIAAVGGNKGAAKGLLAVEIVIEGSFRHARRPEDLVDPDRREALLCQRRDTAAYELLAYGLPLSFRFRRAATAAALGNVLVHGYLIDRSSTKVNRKRAAVATARRISTVLLASAQVSPARKASIPA